MIFIFIIFFINLLISNSRFRQAKYLYFLSSLLHISLYLISSEYSVDYQNYLNVWKGISALGSQYNFLVEDFIFYQIVILLQSLNLPFISLPIFSLLLSIYSLYILSDTLKKSSGLISSSLILPFTTYLSFHILRQSISISFLILAISFLLSTNSDSYKKYKIIIFSLFALFTHFTLSIYFLSFIIFYFYSDTLVNLKSNIFKINLKINKIRIIYFLISIFVYSSILFFTSNIIFSYILRFTFYSNITTDSKYSASSAILFAIFSCFLALFIIYKFLKYRVWETLSRSEKALVFTNVFSLFQFLLFFIAPTISMRISFYSLLISVLSIAILNKYTYLNILQLRFFSYCINIFFIGLIYLAPTLTFYRSLLPF